MQEDILTGLLASVGSAVVWDTTMVTFLRVFYPLAYLDHMLHFATPSTAIMAQIFRFPPHLFISPSLLDPLVVRLLRTSQDVSVLR